MLWLTCIAKDDPQQFAVLLSEVKLAVHGDSQARFQVLSIREYFITDSLLLSLHHLVVGLNDCFLAWKIVVSSTLRHVGSIRDLLHSRRVESFLSKEGECTLKNVMSCLFALTG